ncbi:MAG: SPOR domain-containing protein, partial [Gammaproteobacteria bacterium]|nr:SPOR domain-containing protein [Gammaproteobacteria bacterium]
AVSSGQIARQEPEGVPSLQPLPPDPPPAAPIAVAWIHNQPAQHYTLQIAVAPNEALVRELLAQNPLEGDNAIVALHAARGKTQYALIWGDFANHADAKTARDALPKALRRQQPWIRTFAEVHKQMVQ